MSNAEELNETSRRRVIWHEDGSVTLVTDQPGLTISAPDAIDSVTIEIEDEEWSLLHGALATHDIVLDNRTNKLTLSKKPKRDKE